ncbi:hypothetical protein NEOLEDRAFT_1184483 [Neolentinus lepideus HHB14362 ss-1]|uniref:DUF6534 domain-containing protein n=1 Tax=Neolentinus lepideus HHB14362 ss-1 TaxID=1314782 RepID=A0A165MDS7_9AGAM|nr:hypothetical protein NEOLEDRAFT_1184483 [Neolentinus lepideus HHB14362 ss-1]
MFMGAVVNVFLYGIMVAQCYTYFVLYKTDRYWIRSIVCALLFIDTLSCIFDILMVYDYMVINFANPAAIEVLNIAIAPYPVLTGITACIVQFFFSWRIQTITKAKFLSVIIYILAVVQMLGALGTSIGGVIVHQFVLLERVKSVSLIWLFGSVATDALITIALVWYLRSNRTGFAATDDLVTKIMRSTVQTGALTTTFAIATAVAYLVSDATTMHLAFGVPLSKLYTNSLVSSLNSRQAWTAGHRVDALSMPALRPTAISLSSNTKGRPGLSHASPGQNYEMTSPASRSDDNGPIHVLVQHDTNVHRNSGSMKAHPFV